MMTFGEFRKQLDYRDLNRASDLFADYFHENVQVGDGATVCYWSDRHAYDVIAKTPRTLTLRRCKATLKPTFKPEFIPGGFSAHCVNNHKQDYDYEEDPDGMVVKAYWSEKEHRYYVNKLPVIAGRSEFMDYNF